MIPLRLARPGVALLLLGIAAAGVAGPAPARQAELLHMLRHDCGSCHGMTLRGGLGPPLLPETLGPKDPDTLTATVLHGRLGTPMPPWRGILTADEAAWLVKILREGVPDAP
ncbi:c-type cytochrome [Thioalbus denitrificans]|uniref:Cytochrome c55X n=1 Tax=Thioalbus denitrificans TaxID=547122 RepID=A0A369CNA1_9GAMM|nr:cytochrome c [Thioalbus denitrificans]RCX33334.1 cytochrome c55X [Thioalbus denitrificans]